MFYYLLTPWNQTQLISSVANKTLGKKISGCKTHQLRAALVEAAQVEGDDQDPGWDPSYPLPWGSPLGETQGSIWVPSDNAELENDAGYIMSCSTWEVKCTYLFSEITTHHIKSVICKFKWLVVQRQQFHSTVKHWQFLGDEGTAISHLLWRKGPDSEDGPQLMQGCSPVDK